MQDGAAALVAAAALLPDVIVLDISMPGCQASRSRNAYRTAGSRAAIVFLTVHNDAEVVDAALAASGIGYVSRHGSRPTWCSPCARHARNERSSRC